ncbi:MAG: FIST C-terminal domain-containing protein [Deltaproteobacteria bacterium]|nr:FIST C-terminal domain-containing protein [Deltaproteobacteria bacterium]
MSLITGVGFSTNRNPQQAGMEAAQNALADAGIETPDFVFLFATVGYKQEPVLHAVLEATGNAPLSGCSGEGIIFSGEVHETNFGVLVTVVKSDEISFTNAYAVGMSENAEAMGKEIADQLQHHKADDAVSLLVFGDGLTLNFDGMMRGLMYQCSSLDAIPVMGGTASDDWSFSATYQYYNDKVFKDGAVATLICGEAEMYNASRHGCVPISEELTVTKSVENRILEIDGRSALEVIDEYLTTEEKEGEWSATNVYLAIGVRAPEFMEKYDDYLIRFMPMRDQEAVYVPAEIAEGTKFYMTRRDHEKIAAGNQRLAEQMQQGLKGRVPRFMLQIECIGRGKVIFEDSEKQQLLKDMQQAVCPDAKWFGLYTYGEFGPVGGVNSFHNYSLVLTAIM